MKTKKIRAWPRNLTAKQIRQDIDSNYAHMDDLSNEAEELVKELERRGLSVSPIIKRKKK